MFARQRVDGEGEHLLFDQAVAVLHLERLTDEGDRHVGADHLVAADDDEVDVGDRLRHRVTLHVAGDRQVGPRAGVERQQLVRPGLAVQCDPQFARPHGHRHGLGPVPVDDAGDLPLAPEAAQGARAFGAPGFGGKYDFGHDGSPRVRRERRARATGSRAVRTAYQRSRPWRADQSRPLVPGPRQNGPPRTPRYHAAVDVSRLSTARPPFFRLRPGPRRRLSGGARRPPFARQRPPRPRAVA